MKPLYILLVALFFSLSHCDDEGEATACSLMAQATGVEDCNSRKNPKDTTEYACCLAKYKLAGVDLQACVSLSEDQYDDIDETIESFKKSGNLEELDIDCNSNYIILSVLSLILLLL